MRQGQNEGTRSKEGCGQKGWAIQDEEKRIMTNCPPKGIHSIMEDKELCQKARKEF